MDTVIRVTAVPTLSEALRIQHLLFERQQRLQESFQSHSHRFHLGKRQPRRKPRSLLGTLGESGKFSREVVQLDSAITEAVGKALQRRALEEKQIEEERRRERR